jgi:hypothetical protein
MNIMWFYKGAKLFSEDVDFLIDKMNIRLSQAKSVQLLKRQERKLT